VVFLILAGRGPAPSDCEDELGRFTPDTWLAEDCHQAETCNGGKVQKFVCGNFAVDSGYVVYVRDGRATGHWGQAGSCIPEYVDCETP